MAAFVYFQSGKWDPCVRRPQRKPRRKWDEKAWSQFSLPTNNATFPNHDDTPERKTEKPMPESERAGIKETKTKLPSHFFLDFIVDRFSAEFLFHFYFRCERQTRDRATGIWCLSDFLRSASLLLLAISLLTMTTWLSAVCVLFFSLFHIFAPRMKLLLINVAWNNFRSNRNCVSHRLSSFSVFRLFLCASEAQLCELVLQGATVCSNIFDFPAHFFFSRSIYFDGWVDSFGGCWNCTSACLSLQSNRRRRSISFFFYSFHMGFSWIFLSPPRFSRSFGLLFAFNPISCLWTLCTILCMAI